MKETAFLLGKAVFFENNRKAFFWADSFVWYGKNKFAYYTDKKDVL